MATGFFPVGDPTMGGVVPADIHMKCAASTDIAVGDALDLTSGYLTLANTGDAVVCVAAEAVTGKAATYPYIGVWLVDERRLFEATTATTAPAQTTIGTKIDYAVETTGAYTVDPGTTTNGDFLVYKVKKELDPAESGTLAAGDKVIGVFAHRLGDYDTNT